MAIRSGFFNSVNGDRKYDAKRFAEYFATFIGNGVFPNPSTNLQVMANNNMTITVKAGKAWINGYILINDDDYILNIAPADGVLNRTDRIVARHDVVDRGITLEVKKGTFASEPTPPVLQRDADAYELALADVYVKAGAISITQANITDLRLNKELCGIVHGTIEQVDTTTIFNQFQDWYSNTKENYDNDIATWTEEKKEIFNTWYTQNTTAFTDQWNTWYGDNTTQWSNNFTEWFNSIKGQLDGDIGARLTQEVTNLQNNKVDKAEGKGLSTEDYTTEEKEKLEGIEEGANKYVHPNTHSANIIVQNSEKRFVSDAEKSNWNKKPSSQRPVSDSVTSTSLTVAASSAAVKTAYDKGAAAYNLANTKEPAFSKNSGFNKNKSDSVTSTSTTTLATSKAVKTAYDKGKEALNKANSNSTQMAELTKKCKTSQEIRSDVANPLRVEVVSSFPTATDGCIVYHSGEKKFFGASNGEWL